MSDLRIGGSQSPATIAPLHTGGKSGGGSGRAASQPPMQTDRISLSSVPQKTGGGGKAAPANSSSDASADAMVRITPAQAKQLGLSPDTTTVPASEV